MIGKGRGLIVLSIFTRAAVLAVIALGACWPTYLNLHAAYNNPRIVGLSHGANWESFYRLIQNLDQWLGHDGAVADMFSGTGAALTIFGVDFVDPLMALSAIAANPSAVLGLVASLAAVTLVALLIGRGYCSFGCPASLFFTLSLRLRERIESRVPKLVEFRRQAPAGTRYGILLGGIIGAFLTGTWIWTLLLPYLMISSELVSLISGAPLGFTFSLFSFVVLSDFLVFPGEFCRSACPLGLVLGLMSRHATLRVVPEDRPCRDNCEDCITACGLALNPSETTPPDCSLCGRCIPACPAGKLSMRLVMPFKKHVAKASAVIAIFAIFALTPSTADAHHYHGLPHYGYFDNYPQTPTEEYIAAQGRYELNFTMYNFQGMTRADVEQPEDVQIFLVVFDLEAKTTYGGKSKITIMDGDQKVATFNKEAEQESIFFVHTALPESSNLQMQIEFTGKDGEQVTISTPFHLPGEGGRGPLLWIGIGLVLLIIAMFFASKQKRPTRNKGTTTQ